MPLAAGVVAVHPLLGQVAAVGEVVAPFDLQLLRPALLGQGQVVTRDMGVGHALQRRRGRLVHRPGRDHDAGIAGSGGGIGERGAAG